jgi:O-antigen/teichoic acid export membrane protein
VKPVAALALFAFAQFAALIVSFFFFAAAAFAGDQHDPEMYWWAAGGILILVSPVAGFGLWWQRKRQSRDAVSQPDSH